MPEIDERFPDLDAAFARLRASAPAAVPGAAAAKETVRHRRTLRRTAFGLAAVLLVVAAAGIGWLLRLHDDTVTVRIAPATGASSGAPSEALDLSTVKLYDGATLNVPQRPGGCPAATLHLSGQTRSDTVGGVEYTYYGQSVLALGDLTGDGHAESVILVDCRYQGTQRHVLVVVAATGRSTYTTIAAQTVDLTVSDPGLRVEDRQIVVYDSHDRFDAGHRVGRYALNGDATLTRLE